MFGNVAGSEITENDADVTRGVEMMLPVKDAGVWRIAAQAWDTEAESKRLPAELLPPAK
jgi:hypothetical protein